MQERWWWVGKGGERSGMGSAINVKRITHYYSRKRTEVACSESNLNLTRGNFCQDESNIKTSEHG